MTVRFMHPRESNDKGWSSEIVFQGISRQYLSRASALCMVCINWRKFQSLNAQMLVNLCICTPALDSGDLFTFYSVPFFSAFTSQKVRGGMCQGTSTELTYLELFQCSYQCLIDSFELFSAQLYLKFFLNKVENWPVLFKISVMELKEWTSQI